MALVVTCCVVTATASGALVYGGLVLLADLLHDTDDPPEDA